MTVDSPKQKKHDYGALCDTIKAKPFGPLFRAAACVVLSVFFFYSWYANGVFSSDIGALRIYLPLVIPVIALVYSVPLALSVKNRLDFYERGMVYHTAWFEMDAAWDTVTNISLNLDRGNGRMGFSRNARVVPVLMLNITFREENPWVFRSNTYADLITKGKALADRFQKDHPAEECAPQEGPAAQLERSNEIKETDVN